MMEISKEPPMKESLRIFTQRITKLPTIPPVANKIIDLVDSRDAYVDSVVETIEKDPAISAKVISFSNTAFFRLGSPVTNITDAVMKIGFDNVKGIALGISLLTVFKADKPGRNAEYAHIFRHCLAVGIIAKEIEEYLDTKYRGDVFTSGLLHDIGLLVMHSFFPDISEQVIQMVKKGKKYLEAENEIYGFMHGDVGAWLADQWNLPDSIREAIYCHHNINRAELNPRTAAVVHIADNIAIKNGCSPVLAGGFEYTVNEAALKEVGITKTEMAAIEKKMDNVLSTLQDVYV
jgi:putative nucleotidyltransferase with HDIG domain